MPFKLYYYDRQHAGRSGFAPSIFTLRMYSDGVIAGSFQKAPVEITPAETKHIREDIHREIVNGMLFYEGLGFINYLVFAPLLSGKNGIGRLAVPLNINLRDFRAMDRRVAAIILFDQVKQ